MLALVMFSCLSMLATNLITEVRLVGGADKNNVNSKKAALVADGWIDTGKDLNAGAGGDYIYLLYKTQDTDAGLDFDYITDFYIWRIAGSVSSSSFNPSIPIEYDGRTYLLTPYEGSDDFCNAKGDLNRGAGGEYLYLYYTKERFPDHRAVMAPITFNSNSTGALGANGGSDGIDLNKDAHGEYIYMHFTTAVVSNNPDVIINPEDPTPVVIIPGYNLWLGSTRVTEENKDNIFGQLDANNRPTARYNSTTHTLTLNNPTISGAYLGWKIYAVGMNLTVVGSYDSEGEGGLQTDGGSLTLSGNFAFSGGNVGVSCNVLTVTGVSSSLDAAGTTAGLQSDSISLDEDLVLNSQPTHTMIQPVTALPEVPYNLWVGETQVTSHNKSNILNELDINDKPTARYNPNTHTLTLNNPTINGFYDDSVSYSSSKVYANGINLTIAGKYSFSDSNRRHDIQACFCVDNGSLTLEGQFSFDIGIDAYTVKAPSVILRTGTLTAKCSDIGCGIRCNALTIESGFARLESLGEMEAIWCYDITMASNLVIAEPINGFISNGMIQTNEDTHPRHIILINTDPNVNPDVDPALLVVPYGLWLGDTQVTSANQDNILNQVDGNDVPTATYDPATKRLTLNNPTISGTHGNAKIYSSIIGLDLYGSYHMSAPEAYYGFLEDADSYDYDVDLYNTCLNGDFTFYGSKTGLKANGHAILTILGGRLKAVGTNEYGLGCEDDLIADQVRFHLELQGGIRALENNYFHLDCSDFQQLIVSEPAGGYFDFGGVKAADGSSPQHFVMDVVSLQSIDIIDNDNNLFVVERAHEYGWPVDVTLKGRTLYKDGCWNTICLPFDVTLANSPLAGAEVRYLSEASFSEGTLTLTFSEPINVLPAGYPYIIRWEKAPGYDEANPATRDLVEPTFEDVMVKVDDAITYTTTNSPYQVRFAGTFKYLTPNAFGMPDPARQLYLISGNRLAFPQEGASLGACRGFFLLPEAGQAPSRILMNADGETVATDLEQIQDESTSKYIDPKSGQIYIRHAGTWYDVLGRRKKYSKVLR